MPVKSILKIVRVIVAAATISYCGNIYSQEGSTPVRINFKQGQYLIGNEEETSELDSTIQALSQLKSRPITKIEIECYSSPEGGYARNIELAYLRGESGKIHLIEQLGVPDSIISISSAAIAWDEFWHLAELNGVSSNDQAEEIIENYPELLASLRYINIFIQNQTHPSIAGSVTLPPFYTIATCYIPHVANQGHQNRTLLALKTNLLFDLATLVNLEVEIPIKERWSIAAEFIFPWWTMDNHQADSRRNRIQLHNGNLEGRYWWGDRTNKAILTGWFSGLYVGGGVYDFEYDAKGYQGDFFIAAGLSGGYAHTINRAENLRLEYSIGIGYLSTDYQYYHSEYCDNNIWHAVEQQSGRFNWFGPTRAKISLSWLINYKSKR